MPISNIIGFNILNQNSTIKQTFRAIENIITIYAYFMLIIEFCKKCQGEEEYLLFIFCTCNSLFTHSNMSSSGRLYSLKKTNLNKYP